MKNRPFVLPALTELYDVEIPPKECSFANRIANGGYDFINPHIAAERFPLTLPPGRRPLALAHFDDTVANDDIRAWLDDSQYRFAVSDDMLAVGANSTYKRLQCRFPIVLPCNPVLVFGDQQVLCLTGSKNRRGLDLYSLDRNWAGKFRFLVVHKMPDPPPVGRPHDSSHTH